MKIFNLITGGQFMLKHLGLFMIIMGFCLVVILIIVFLIKYYSLELLYGSIIITIVGFLLMCIGIGREKYIKNKEDNYYNNYEDQQRL